MYFARTCFPDVQGIPGRVRVLLLFCRPYLELATDYTTQGFLAACRRFVGRRGQCSTLTSDCGTNLVGADAELCRLFHSAFKESALTF